MRCTTTHLQVIATEDNLIEVDNRRVSIPKGISVLEVKPGWNVELATGVTAYDLPANAFFFSRSNNDREFQLLKEKLDLITSNISENQSVISSQLSALAADVAEIKATGAKSSEVSAIISRLDELSGNVVTVSQLNELSGQIDETYLKISDYNPATGNIPPVGFVYAQYPGMLTPWDLFGDIQSNWTERFNTEGVFFRTPGGNASAFESGIQGQQLITHTHQVNAENPNRTNLGTDTGGQTVGSVSIVATTYTSSAPNVVNGTETRPYNRTFKLWEKTSNG